MAKKQNVKKVAAPQKSGDFVTAKSYNDVIVKSKLPFGLKFNTPDGKVWEIKGMNQSKLVSSEGMLGYFATCTLPADVWAYFAKINGDKPYFKNKHIFAEVSAQKADGLAKELGNENKTKMEQINPKDVPNIQKAEDAPKGNGVTA